MVSGTILTSRSNPEKTNFSFNIDEKLILIDIVK